MARRLMRAPRYLYDLRLGRLLGRRFVLIEHTGRKSGLPRKTVLEVVGYDDTSMDVAAAWGSKSDWFQNLVANPAARVSSGRLRGAPATAAAVAPAEAAAVFDRYAREHRRAARALASALQLPFDDPAAMAAAVPLLRLTLD